MDFSLLTILNVEMTPQADIVASLLARLRQVRELLGQEDRPIAADTRFVDVLDSMGFVEFLGLVADDCGVPVERIEQAAGHRYGTVGELAYVFASAGFSLSASHSRSPSRSKKRERDREGLYLAATAAVLPSRRQSASEIDALLGRPSGWLQARAGIQTRCLWGDEDPMEAAARAAQECLRRAGLSPNDVGAVLVTSEAPPLPVGLAAALHGRIGLAMDAPALEIGGACTGFLAALWTACRLLKEMAAIVVIAVEAPSRWLSLSPSAAGEAAALFGDGAAACLLTAQPTTANALPLRDVILGTDGTAGSLLRVGFDSGMGAVPHWDGMALAQRAVRTMADAVRRLSARHGLNLEDLLVVAHGGNGRMPALLARRLGVPPERVWSETAHTGNLGSASLPVAWSANAPSVSCPVTWTAVGAGLQWGAALFDVPA
jgi:3-oxoacyl-[acyl-carrier-protein] synthase-3